MRGELGRALALGIVFLAGLASGIWVFVSPWAVGYPTPPGGGWTASLWSSVAIGALVTAASGVSLIAVLAHGLRRALG